MMAMMGPGGPMPPAGPPMGPPAPGMGPMPLDAAALGMGGPGAAAMPGMGPLDMLAMGGPIPGLPSTDPQTWLALGAQQTMQDQAAVGQAAGAAMQQAADALGMPAPMRSPMMELGGPQMGGVDGGAVESAMIGGGPLDAAFMGA